MAKKGIIAYPLVSLGFDASDYRVGMESVGAGVKRFATIANTSFRSITMPGNLVAGMVTPLNQGLELLNKINRIFGQPFQQLMAQEKAAGGLELLAGNAKMAKAGFDELRNSARTTGEPLEQLATQLKVLTTSGQSFAEATTNIELFANAASALGEGGLGKLVEASGAFATNTIASTEALDKLAADGIPIYQALGAELSRLYGRQVSIAEASMMLSQGKVSGATAGNALNAAIAMPEVKAAAAAADATFAGTVGKLQTTWNDTLARMGDGIVKGLDLTNKVEWTRGFLDGGRILVESITTQMGLANIEGSFENGLASFDSALEFGAEIFVAFVEGLEVTVQALATMADKFLVVVDGLGGALEHTKAILARPISGTLEAIGAAVFGGEKGPARASLVSANPLGSDKLATYLKGRVQGFREFSANGADGRVDLPFDPNVAAKAKAAQQIAQGKALAAANDLAISLNPAATAAKGFADQLKSAQMVVDQMAKVGLDGTYLLSQAKIKLQTETLKTSNDFLEGLYNTGGALGSFAKTMESIETQAAQVAGAGLDAQAFTLDAQTRATAQFVKNFKSVEQGMLLPSQNLGSSAEVEARLAERFGAGQMSLEETIAAAANQAHADALAQQNFLKGIQANSGRAPAQMVLAVPR